ncbi:uncharacterized protein J3D65DRAFT_619106 [Phyllosticta citribraziliensis]|uniref:DNA repair protein Rad26 n=1 Tax=Phyllosticta citribraziliensis TaxID=989973 RepID=A0ABR1LWJ7_9PEZI
MATEDDEFGFADDLEDLPANTWREIEAQALLSTQHRPQTQKPADDHESDYGFDDEDVINLDDVNPRVPSAPQPARDERDAFYQHRLNRHAGVGHAVQSAAQASQGALGTTDTSNQELLKLRREHALLERDRNSKAGEASIIRSNYEKLVKEYNTKDSLKDKAHAEENARYLAQVRDLERRLEQVNAANKFLENDLKQVAAKARQKSRTLKDGSSNTARGSVAPVTPRKNRAALIGDGFDDGDVVMVSPSKSRERSKQFTPKKGSKRKRTIGESPGKPLPLSEPAVANGPEPTDTQEPESHNEILVEFEKDDDKFRFLKRLLNHRTPGSDARFVETMAKFALPSNQNQPLSSMLYDGLILYRSGSQDFPTHVCRILASIWEKCLKESYYLPLSPLIDTLLFVLAFESLEKTAALADAIIPLVVESATVALNPGTGPAHEEVPLSSSLSLLLLISRHAAHSEDATASVWKLVPQDFPLLILKRPQLSSNVDLMLRILATSVTSSSFGPIACTSTSDRQPFAQRLLDYLVVLLTNRGTPAAIQRSLSKEGLVRLRFSLLQTFSAMITSPTGSSALARHSIFLGNAVTLLNDSLDSLYTTTPGALIRQVIVNIVNLATRILYTLLMSQDTKHLIDRKAKLAAVPGASHKHLVGLTRLAFVELDENDPDNSTGGLPAGEGLADDETSAFSRWKFGSVLESGIDEEVVDMAHTLLDEFLSPEEGEMLVSVFSSGKSSI